MAKITFYPLGNADSTLIEFADDRLMLNDYYRPESFDEDDKRIDLSEELDKVLDSKSRDYFDIVAFSHRDQDHVEGAEKYFQMKHAPDNNDYGTVEIRELWIPSYFIIETSLKCESAKIRIRHYFCCGFGTVMVIGCAAPRKETQYERIQR